MSIDVLGVRIDTVSLLEAKENVRTFLLSTSSHTIFTPNPEMLVKAHKDKIFQDILNGSSLNICDGKGISFVSKKRVQRITGVDFMHDVLSLSESMGKSVYLLGSGSDRTLKALKVTLLGKYPRLSIVGMHPGPNVVEEPNGSIRVDEMNTKVIQDIQEVKPDVLFVAFGQGKQEKWIHGYIHKMPFIRVCVGVGGAFDMISGTIRRAPRVMRFLGFEWIWRLILEPSRIKRIYNATIVFLFLFYIKQLYVSK
ncbi:MAG: WecB/TagA/CpsF family glycosyltransferase [Candidatus Magasanikbacteria bacterium]|jgi:N-acetylglucosaminyldiphosphoundecaprenol N-acetyl-beta-D-mannosaminyltransferase|nr:WecB/TagA/CpsF family glycosyltransferase [Candidatus Magasanikbacteria bacterium]MBT4221335.1 WecB/TagA/CpsF family glycosyltransferase [Candidatus Magasanikbacteria bacterium]MBT4350817.1 WecB/TagA/CpsF family glycosyltransferase [Candidatus Magasanikbacteria bacterium]MBT4542183.1 WecB/TagA/CpsF family glycosyltransferase [Candidatus Magasanikbacteria bacterium]MBT6253459.1 WecB/TagA/CpsF family glycosyltransferase [Candidatus Magasanikbacteria bacterium]